MTLANTLLEKLSDWKHPGDGRHTFAVLDPHTGVTVHLAVEHLERLSCQLWEARITRPAGAVAQGPSLADWAAHVAAEATGLLEPLKVVEVDDVHGHALLRSDEPAEKQDDLFYYELLLQQSGAAFVRRYRGSRQPTKREQVSFILTREALGKLVEDIAV